LLESIPGTLTATGTWVNVIGYILENPLLFGDTAAAPPPPTPLTTHPPLATIRIQAIVMWPAGAVNVEKYERILRDLDAAHEKDASRINVPLV